jgi:hypothetical protein
MTLAIQLTYNQNRMEWNGQLSLVAFYGLLPKGERRRLTEDCIQGLKQTLSLAPLLHNCCV